jgi:hypothetical protein
MGTPKGTAHRYRRMPAPSLRTGYRHEFHSMRLSTPGEPQFRRLAVVAAQGYPWGVGALEAGPTTLADFPGKSCPRCADPAGTTFRAPGTAKPSIHAGLRPLSPCPRCPRAQSAEVEIRVGTFTRTAGPPTVVPVRRAPRMNGGRHRPPDGGTRPPTKPAGNLAGNSISTFSQSQHSCGLQGIL